MNRKQRRAMKKHTSPAAQERLAEQMTQFGMMPEQCGICAKDFDKKNKEMVQSWSVFVKQEVVRLFCPDCMDKAKEVVGGSDPNNS